MLSTLFDVAIGLVVGWFFLPRPAWSVALINYVATKIPFIAPYIKD